MSFFKLFRIVVRCLALFSPGIACIAMAQNPVPLISQPLVPDAVTPGEAGFTLTVNGTGFVSTSVVKWNGAARPTTFVSASQLKANILASDVAVPRTASVTVVSPRPGGGSSNNVFFPINAPAFIALRRTGYALGAQPQFVATADFNEDGKLDLVIANFRSNSVSILLGQSNGTFQTRVDYPTCSSPVTPVIGDFNGDGKLDVAVVCSTSTIAVLLGNWDGTFQAGAEYQTGSVSSYGMAADLNGDG